MKRTTIMVDESTLLELGQLADERNVSASQLIREALAEYVVTARAAPQPAWPLPSFVGVGEGPTDLSERAEELLEALTSSEKGWD